MKIRQYLQKAMPWLSSSLWASKAGNVGLMVAILAVPIIGALGLAVEVSSWLVYQREMQNAADSAVLAAATNGNSATFVSEGRAVASLYGFTNGTNNTAVSVTDGVVCPGTSETSCYQVTITKSIPLYLTQVTGYTGDVDIASGRGKLILATSVAGPLMGKTGFCVLALATGAGQGIDARGSPKADLQKCNIASNSNSNCSGHDLNAGTSYTVGYNNDCGTTQVRGAPPIVDNLAVKAANIPANSCGSYYPSGHPSWPAATNALSGSLAWPTTKTFCGDVKLTGNVFLTTPSAGTVMVIQNGSLNLNGFKLITQPGSGLTVIFTSPLPDTYTSGGTVTNFFTGNGTLDIVAPSSGFWSGLVMYQNPALPEMSVTYSGSNPTWNITGYIYIPKTNLTMTGAVNKSTNGLRCFAMAVRTLTIKGSAYIFYHDAQAECSQSGVTPATATAVIRMQLVQ